MKNVEEKIQTIIKNSFVKINEKFFKENKIESYEEDTDLFILSLKHIVDSLNHINIDVIEIINTGKSDECKKGFLLKYTFFKQDLEIRFLDSMKLDNQNFVEIIAKQFNLPKRIITSVTSSLCPDFPSPYTYECGNDWCIHFIKGDIINEPDIFYTEWERWIFWNREVPILSETFRPKKFQNFNKIYELPKDNIIKLEEIIQEAPQIKILSHDFNSIQESIAHLQLIPKVPEDIRRMFSRVKKLFIYGYFEYEFFTIAQHYAYMTLESAIKARYMHELGQKVSLTSSKKNFKEELNSPTYFDIIEYCRNKKCKIQEVYVNGEKFACNTFELLKWLEKHHLIRKWEIEQYKAGIDLRNIYSHPEKYRLTGLGTNILHNIVSEINHIFHKDVAKK